MSFTELLRSRVEAAKASLAFRNYAVTREHVLRMKDQAPGSGADPSSYWQEELANFDYMLDAHPLVIERLRHHTYHLTGLRVYDYRTHKDQAQAAFAEKLDVLSRLGGKNRLVPEAQDMGGFGFRIDGALYNIDTLKFYEVLIALDRGSVLGDFEAPPTRRVVWEIGAGWGGFAYQFKRLFPKVTYVIVDFPELFLFSATYLMTLFPEAKSVFYDRAEADQLDDLGDVDFVFWPHYALDELQLPGLDLTIDMVSFQEMTTAQVSGYVEHAHRLGSPYLYSLNRDRSSYNDQLTSVSEIIDTRYWPHEVTVLDVPYTQMLDRKRTTSQAQAIVAQSKRILGVATETPPPRRLGDYRHIVGWRRVEAR